MALSHPAADLEPEFPVKELCLSGLGVASDDGESFLDEVAQDEARVVIEERCFPGRGLHDAAERFCVQLSSKAWFNGGF